MHKYYFFTGCLAIFTLLVVIQAFLIIGNPWDTKKRENDNTRSMALQSLKYGVESYYRSNNNTLPASFEQMGNLAYEKYRTDPVTGKQYEYARKTNNSFQLCANFQTDSTKNDSYKYGSGLYIEYNMDNSTPNFYRHNKGRVCFTSYVNVNTTPSATTKPQSSGVTYRYTFKGDSKPEDDQVTEGVITAKSLDPSGSYIISLSVSGEDEENTVSTTDRANMVTMGYPDNYYPKAKFYYFDEETQIVSTDEATGKIKILEHKDLHVRDNVKIKYGYTTNGQYYARIVTLLD